jgi:hypothetical protein
VYDPEYRAWLRREWYRHVLAGMIIRGLLIPILIFGALHLLVALVHW